MRYFLLVLVVFKLLYAPTETFNLNDIRKSAVDVVKSAAGKIPNVIPTSTKNVTTESMDFKNIGTPVEVDSVDNMTEPISTNEKNDGSEKPSTLQNIQKSAVNVITGVAQKIPDVIPSVDDLFQLGKNIVAGYPFEKVFSAINSFCSAALSAQNIKPRSTPNIANLSYVLKVNDQNISVPLNEPKRLWLLKEFNSSLPLVMVITGWTTTGNDDHNPALDVLYAAYRCRGNVNFVAVDTGGFVDTLYTWSAFNTEEIGNVISDSLIYLVQNYPTEKIHLIGHSLGAHVAGSAGRHFYFKTGKLLPKITALDAANPCFNPGENLTGVQRGDADFVVAIHSNNGGLGKREPYGDVDFYPNGVQPLPPGCLSLSCAHHRAVEYFAESVIPGNENNFMAVKCGSLSSLNGNFCPGTPVPMGYATPQNLKGNFFLKTNDERPYGINATENGQSDCFARKGLVREEE